MATPLDADAAGKRRWGNGTAVRAHLYRTAVPKESRKFGEGVTQRWRRGPLGGPRHVLHRQPGLRLGAARDQLQVATALALVARLLVHQRVHILQKMQLPHHVRSMLAHRSSSARTHVRVALVIVAIVLLQPFPR